MNLIELHMLQSFPVNCLNRDQFGSPKGAFFGGVPRARVSSQCWKRAIRMFAKEETPMFAGNRSKGVFKELKNALLAKGKTEAEAEKMAEKITTAAKIKLDKDGQAKNLFYFSNSEIETALAAYDAAAKNPEDAVVKALKKVTRDGVDIAFFGRMVADSELTLEGAAMFSHALSVNRVDNDLDFFTAVDDLKPQEQTGAAHMGDIEFNTACYYRYVAINLDLLADQEHLASLSLEERVEAIRYFLRACVMAVPQARHNSMQAGTLPGFILGMARKGSPLSLANAFEKPVTGTPLLEQAQQKMLAHWQELKSLYSLAVDKESILPDHDLNTMLKDLTSYVK